MTSEVSPTGDQPREHADPARDQISDQARRRFVGGDHPRLPLASTGTFVAAVGRATGHAGLIPAVLARAVVRVLPVEAASLSIWDGVLRLPLGASGELARRAEKLETSLGEGPCLDAVATQVVVVADLDELEVRWPSYGKELVAATPFRAVASVPLSTLGHGVLAAVDLYSTNPQLSGRLDRYQLDQVAAAAAALLATCVDQLRDVDAPDTGPDWYQAAARHRHGVWIAIGMVMANRTGRARDALRLLRVHARITSRNLDDLAADIINGRVALTDLTDQSPMPNEQPGD